MADFLDIFGEDFSSVLASLDQLTPEVETMLLGVMDKMVYDVKTFSNSLEKTVFSMSQAGVSDDIIKQTLANDMGTGGRIFGQLRNDTKASIVDGINQSAKMGQYKNYDLDKGDFVWVTVGGHKVCPDCDARAGIKMTFAEWEAEGIPGSGWSVCQGFCYCVLDPTGKASKKIDAPVREKGARPQKPEKRFFPMSHAQARALAQKELRRVNKIEKANTARLKQLAASHNGEMSGLEFRMKDLPSSTRKIMKENQTMKYGPETLIREDLADLNRYTMLVDDKYYRDSVLSALGELEAEGYKIVKVKNTWHTTKYRGMNCNLLTPEGQIFELQFHTPKSLNVKFKYSHPLYEEYRKLGTTAVRKLEIEQELAKRWGKVPQPPGVFDIETIINTIPPPENWDIYY